jgi:hypothetical protein
MWMPFARDIRAGNWMMNAQPICFARDGRLLNGQHRLSAVLQAGEAIEVPVMRGLPEEAYATYDIHAKKGPQLGAAFDNFGDKPLVAAAAVLLWKRELKPSGIRNAKPTPSEVMKIIEQHPRLLELRTFGRKMIEFGRGSVLTYAAYCIERDDPELGRVFVERFETGADLPRGHLILELRKRMQIMRRERTSQDEQLKEVLGRVGALQGKAGSGAAVPRVLVHARCKQMQRTGANFLWRCAIHDSGGFNLRRSRPRPIDI